MLHRKGSLELKSECFELVQQDIIFFVNNSTFMGSYVISLFLQKISFGVYSFYFVLILVLNFLSSMSSNHIYLTVMIPCFYFAFDFDYFESTLKILLVSTTSVCLVLSCVKKMLQQFMTDSTLKYEILIYFLCCLTKRLNRK